MERIKLSEIPDFNASSNQYIHKIEDLSFKSEVLRCKGCEILPSAKKLDGEKLLSDSKKKVQPFLLQSTGPNVTAGLPHAFYFF